MPEECTEDQILDNLYTYGWGGYDDAAWTITNLITGEEVNTGGFGQGSSSTFMCFEDGVYELTVCDEEGDGYNDFSADICVGNGNECAYVSGWNMSYSNGSACTSDIFTVNMDVGCMEKYGYRWMFGVAMLLLGHLLIHKVTLHSLAIWHKHLGQETLFVV
jgi:hypothetical protein